MILFLLACAQVKLVPTDPCEACDDCGTCDTCDGECVLDCTPATGATHVEGEVDYPNYPPSSGDHDACWADWGSYTEPVAAERWVHNLEHGGIVFLYTPELDAADLATLTTYVGALPEGRSVLTPAEAPMDGIVAALAWEHRLLLGCFDEAALDAFFWEHVGKGPENVTSGPGMCADTGA